MRRKPVQVTDFRIERKRLVIRDAKGRLWERFSDMPIGQWGRIDLPDEPEQKPRRSTKGGK